MKHKFKEYRELAVCTICGGGEGDLTKTDCPGRRMTSEESDGVYKLGWDFVKGQWMKPKLKTVSIPMEKLFFWHSTSMTQCLFPGMESKVGREQFVALQKMNKELEDIIGVDKSTPEFHGG